MKKIVSALVFLLLCLSVNAGYISLSTKIDANVTDSSLYIEVANTNYGNDIATNLLVTTIVGDDFKTGKAKDMLNPEESSTTRTKHNIKSKLPGTYPLIVSVDYSDINSFPFQILTSSYYIFQNESIPKIALQLSGIQLVDKGNIKLYIRNLDTTSKGITLRIYVPNQLEISPASQSIQLNSGSEKELTLSIQNKKALEGSSYGIYAVAEYDENNEHFTNIASSTVKITESFKEQGVSKGMPRLLFLSLFFIFIILNTIYFVVEKFKPALLKKPFFRFLLVKDKRLFLIIDILVFVGIYLFLISYFRPEYMLSKTTSTGGDMASHYYTADFLKNNLIIKGRIAGWSQGNYAGFPMLQFYFPLPFLLMVLLSYLVGMQVAFKLISVLGIFLLPLAAYLCFRMMKFSFPLPIISACSTLSFLFMEANSMWGGNIPSTLAGEFSHSLGFAIMIILVGTLYSGLKENKYVVLNAVLISLIGISHVYTLLFISVTSLYFLFMTKEFKKNLLYFFRMYSLGFLLLGIWIVPLISKLSYTTSFNIVWYISSILEILPKIFFPYIFFTGIALLFAAYKLIKHKKLDFIVGYFAFSMLISVLFYINASRLGVVDIRFFPFLQLYLVLVGVIGFGALVQQMKFKWLIPFIVLFFTLFWVGLNSTYIQHWIPWNYNGFEQKPWWSYYNSINTLLKGDEGMPRVVYEHSDKHNNMGTTRAFESLPYFSGRNTLEGLYMQSELTPPAIFYLQSLVSKQQSCPFGNFGCSRTNVSRAIPRLIMFNVKDYIAVSEEAKSQLNDSDEFELIDTYGDYQVFELKTNPGKYVEVPHFKPNAVVSKYRQQLSYLWFIDDTSIDIPLVFVESRSEINEALFADVKSDSIQDLKREKLEHNCGISEHVTHDKISFTTNCVGEPHIIKISHFPNWKVKGAEKVYWVSPGFMLVFPTQTNVELYYGYTFFDMLGIILTISGLVLIIGSFFISRKMLNRIIARFKIINQLVIKTDNLLDLMEKNKIKVLIIGFILFIMLLSLKLTIFHDSRKDFYTKEIAVATGSFPVCQYAYKYETDCFIEVAEKTGDFNLCNVKINKYPEKDICYYRTAVALKDKNLCNVKIQDSVLRDMCLEEIG
ncbi:hypothetical protein JW930_00925 [Candidatus Woesearchaeota archaeon]|nr:hypothetical protein [Candidatus Woesearchaeota archaeon]